MLDDKKAEILEYFEELSDPKNKPEISVQYSREAYLNAYVNLKNGDPKLAINILTKKYDEFAAYIEKFGDSPEYDLKYPDDVVKIIKMIKSGEIGKLLAKISPMIDYLEDMVAFAKKGENKCAIIQK